MLLWGWVQWRTDLYQIPPSWEGFSGESCGTQSPICALQKPEWKQSEVEKNLHLKPPKRVLCIMIYHVHPLGSVSKPRWELIIGYSSSKIAILRWENAAGYIRAASTFRAHLPLLLTKQTSKVSTSESSTYKQNEHSKFHLGTGNRDLQMEIRDSSYCIYIFSLNVF